LLLEPPDPVLLNTWKHHAGAIRSRIALAVGANERGLEELSQTMAVIGADLMDLYVGVLSPSEIANQLIATLQASNHIAVHAYTSWLNANSGYREISVSDGSRWILRLADCGIRYVHVHPARRASQTLRVRANVVKTAILTLGLSVIRCTEATDVAVINQARQEFLNLPPIAGAKEGRSIRGIIGLLSGGQPGFRRDDEGQHDVNEDAGNDAGKEGC
jgi:hypothetical protein